MRGMTADPPHLAVRKPEGAEPFFAHHRRYDDCFARPQAETVFYRKATFYSAAEVDALMGNTGFDERIWLQTLSKRLAQVESSEPVKPGTGQGAFIVVRAHSR